MTQYPLTDMVRDATFSDCGEYRYSLRRSWVDKSGRMGRLRGGRVCFVMLNPSVADQYHDDQTTTQCIRRVRAAGYNEYEAVNLFAMISTYPLSLRDHPSPVGPMNDGYIRVALERADFIVVAWGEMGSLYDRATYVLRELLHGLPMWCLGRNKSGHPRFPLRVPYRQGFVPYYSQKVTHDQRTPSLQPAR